ncbi:unnamed protein product [Nesidiocoris tenuis]|uniref:DNA polymerase eta n=1 Tax=Nesidiocoris tenuis TaxID=355587 RepID=A0A6H5G2C8_9HEMI|nr:unnamed protein product [Nesidiocoris tenuis]
MSERVVSLVDMDCFYCQVEERLNPELKGKPAVVVQYNPWKGGGIIAVNYEARARGVKRGMRGEEAKRLCHDVVLCSVPMIREKADLTRYRDAGREVVNVMCTFTDCVQRASIDEAYLDLTSVVDKRIAEFEKRIPVSKVPNTFVVGYSKESSNDEAERFEGTSSWLKDIYSSGLEDVNVRKLAVGAVIVEEMRQAIFEKTGFRCSAGIAHNKILAKLTAGLHKPNRQTVLPHSAVAELYSTLPAHKIRNLGGKLGRELEELHGVKMMTDLLKFTQTELTKIFDERVGKWLYDIARGHDNEPVTPRLVTKSIGCCKNFPGKMSLSKSSEVEHWLNKLTEELMERLLEDETLNQRKATHLVFSIRLHEGKINDRGRETSSSKSAPLQGYNHERIVSLARLCLKKFCNLDPATDCWYPIITFLGLSAGKFVDSSNQLVRLFDAIKNNPKKPTVQTSRAPDEGNASPREDFHAVESKTASTRNEVDSIRQSSRESVTSNLNISLLNRTSSLDESVGPSFFEKMLLDDNGNKQRLNVVPMIAHTSPLKKYSTPEKVRTDTTSEKSESKILKAESVSSKIDQQETNCTPRKKSIKEFFKKRKSPPDWVDPLEIFPDLNSIDDETWALFPPSYRQRIVELRKDKGASISKTPSKILNGDPSQDDASFPAGSSNAPRSSADNSNHKELKRVFKAGEPSSSDAIFENPEQPGFLNAEPSRPSIPAEATSMQSVAGPSSLFNNDDYAEDSAASEVVCPDCQLILSSSEYVEHRDYHYAMALQEQINGVSSAVSKPSAPQKAAKPSHGLAKRKNSSKNAKAGEVKKLKSIDSFFKKNS